MHSIVQMCHTKPRSCIPHHTRIVSTPKLLLPYFRTILEMAQMSRSRKSILFTEIKTHLRTERQSFSLLTRYQQTKKDVYERSVVSIICVTKYSSSLVDHFMKSRRRILMGIATSEIECCMVGVTPKRLQRELLLKVPSSLVAVIKTPTLTPSTSPPPSNSPPLPPPVPLIRSLGRILPLMPEPPLPQAHPRPYNPRRAFLFGKTRRRQKKRRREAAAAAAAAAEVAEAEAAAAAAAAEAEAAAARRTIECLICTNPTEDIAHPSSCGHEFCLTCMRIWSSKAYRRAGAHCPICRTAYQSFISANAEEVIWKKVEEYLRLFETYGGIGFSLFLMRRLGKLACSSGRMGLRMKLRDKKELILLFQMTPSRILCDQ